MTKFIATLLILFSLVGCSRPAFADTVNGDMHAQNPDGANWNPLNLDANGNLKVSLVSAAAGFFALFNDISWGTGAASSFTWTFNVSGTDTTLAFGNGLMTMTGQLVVNRSDTQIAYFDNPAGGGTGRIGVDSETNSGISLYVAGVNMFTFFAVDFIGTSEKDFGVWNEVLNGKAFSIDGANNNADFSAAITSSGTGSLGWTPVSGADTACNTTCTSACVFGFNLTAGVPGSPLACTDATADVCICAGAS